MSEEQTVREDLNSEKQMTFLEHLEVLRWNLIRSVSVIVILAIVAFIYHKWIFDYIILAPKSPWFITNVLLCKLSHIVNVDALCINSVPFQVININMSGQFTTHMIVSLMSGVIIAFPYIIFEIWKFLRPALYDKERKMVNGAILYISILFFVGVLFGYYLIVPLTVNFLGTYQVSSEVINQITLTSYISTVSSVVLSSGLIFELPVLVYFIAKIGLITHTFLKKYRRHAIIVVLIVAAIITPPDVFSQIMVSLPLFALYEVSIVIAKRVNKKREQLAG